MEDAFHVLEQNLRGHRFKDVIICAALEAIHHRVHLFTNRDHDNWDAAVSGVLLHLLEECIAVQFGHDHIAKDDIERTATLFHQVKGSLSVLSRKNILTSTLLQVSDCNDICYRIVINHKDS
eukprot:GAFH01003899.1.p3 GENE.GAFH01003899.1~~GAFH01003899.1.p3  ORF type:complete len:122 (+),score=1.31 GAFH01003899.1:383-748(+)